MALSVLSQASALNPGSALWVIPDAANSRWSKKIDWYLNFQLCKADRHVKRELPDYVSGVLQDTDLKLGVSKTAANSPLLIACENLLPNKWVAVVPLHANYSAWVAEIAKLWASLQDPSLRIFLPPGQSAGSFNELWMSHHKHQDFTVVLD